MIIGKQNEESVSNDVTALLSEGAKLAADKDRVLYESQGRKYVMGKLLEGIENETVKSKTAIMLETQRKFFNNLSETTKLINIGDFEKYAFPMVRAIFPNLAAHNLASVQPMQGPVSLVFFMKFLYAISKGTAVAGTDIIENPDASFSEEYVDGEVVATGDGSTATLGTGTLAYAPVKPGTFKMTTETSAAAIEVVDDGNGNLVGDTGAASTINYATGAISITWSAAPDLGAEISAYYEYDFEGSQTLPQIDMQITSAPVTAKTRKLITKWSVEAQQDLRNLHGLDAELEQVAAVTNNIKFEIDRELITDLNRIAVNSVTAWSKTPAAGVGFPEHKLTFIDKLLEASNAIFQATQRATGTWVVCGINVASLIESLPGFMAKPRPAGTRGVYNSGTLNGQWEIWKDPNFGTNSFLMGYQGVEMYETGYIFAPYILAYPTATITLEDFVSRKGLMSRYGKKTVEGKFYCTGSITT